MASRRRYSFLKDALLVLATGIASSLCFPPLALRHLAWFLLVPALVLLRSRSVAVAGALAGLLGLASAAAAFDWLPQLIAATSEHHLSGWNAFLAVALGIVAPLHAAFGMFYCAAGRCWRLTVPLLASAAWVAAEFLSAELFGGVTAGSLGYATARTALVQLADLTGVFGLSFLVILTNVCLAEAWIAYREEEGWSQRLPLTLAAPLALIVLAFGYSQLRLSLSPNRPSDVTEVRADADGALTVAIIQGDLDPASASQVDTYGGAFQTYVQLTGQAVRERPQLVVWPEHAVRSRDLGVGSEPTLAALLMPNRAQLITGAVAELEQAGRHFNLALAIAPNGQRMARYDKQRLLPFVERIPFSQIDFVRHAFAGTTGVVPGESAAPLPAVGGSVGILIGSELLIPEAARERVVQGAKYLLHLSNDTWGVTDKFALFSLDASIVRAVEQPRFLLRASSWGPSAIIDPYGRILQRTRLGRREILNGTIVPLGGLSPYARMGDAFARGCTAITLAAIVLLFLWPTRGERRH